MAKVSPNQFRLISGTNKLVLRTLDIGVPVTTSGDDPGPPAPDQVDIEGTILNPNMFNYQMPTQETPDSSWSVSPLSILLPGETHYDNPPTDDGGAPPPINGEFVYGRNPVIDVGAGLYNDADKLELWAHTINPTEVVSDVPYGTTTTQKLIGRDCSLSERGSATYAPVSVVSFESCATFAETDEWYRPAEYGWYLMKLDVPSARESYNNGGDWWWSTSSSGGQYFCRYNPLSGGLSPYVPGTNDDPEFQGPGAVVQRIVPLSASHPLGPPQENTWWWSKFHHGGPSDFPAGQRLRCVASTYIANGAKVYGTGVTNVGDGLYELKIRRSTGAKWDTNPPYPWPATIPWPQVPGDPGETDGGIEDFDIFKLYFKIRFTKV